MILRTKVRYLRKFKCVLPSFTRKQVNKRKNKPGEHPFFSSKKTSVKNSFIERLHRKQKLKFMFCISEKQLKNYIKFSLIYTKNNPFWGLYNVLHSRLDYIIYKLHFAKTILQARQLVNHGHFFINGVKQKTPSYSCKVGDLISTESDLALNNIKSYLIGRVYFNELKFVDFDKFIISVQKPKFINLEILNLVKSTFEFYI